MSSRRGSGLEGDRLDLLLAFSERSAPGVEVDHGAVVVAEVPEEPPQPLGAAHVPVRDDEDPVTDAGSGGG